MSGMSDAAKIDLIESLGIIFQNEGLPRIAGRVLGRLIVSDGPQSFNELVEALQISKGSVSTNTRLLENLGAVERTARLGDRQDYFRLADAPYEQLLERSIERASRARHTLQKSADRLSKDGGPAEERLAELIFFYDVIMELSQNAAKKLIKRRARQAS